MGVSEETLPVTTQAPHQEMISATLTSVTVISLESWWLQANSTGGPPFWYWTLSSLLIGWGSLLHWGCWRRSELFSLSVYLDYFLPLFLITTCKADWDCFFVNFFDFLCSLGSLQSRALLIDQGATVKVLQTFFGHQVRSCLDSYRFSPPPLSRLLRYFPPPSPPPVSVEVPFPLMSAGISTNSTPVFQLPSLSTRPSVTITSLPTSSGLTGLSPSRDRHLCDVVKEE